MSIENAILELAKSINFHAEVILKINQTKVENEIKSEVSKTQKKPKKPDLALDPVVPELTQTELFSNSPEITTDANEKITSEMCKNLAKEKMASGVDRTKIKDLVTQMGAESIADLDEKNLSNFYKELKSYN